MPYIDIEDIDFLQRAALIEHAIVQLLHYDNPDNLLSIISDESYQYIVSHRFPPEVIRGCLKNETDLDVLKSLFSDATRNNVLDMFSAEKHTCEESFKFENGAPAISLTYAASGDFHCYNDRQDFVLKEGQCCISSAFLSFEQCPGCDSIAIVTTLHEQYYTDVLLCRLPNGKLFDKIFADNILNHCITGDTIVFETNSSKKLSFLMVNAFQEFVANYFLFNEVINSYILLIFSTLLTDYVTRLESNPTAAESTQLHNITDYIQGHLSTATLNNIAEHFHYAPSYLSSLIKSLSGRNFSELVRDAKLNRACVLLQYSALSVKNIINEIGYSNSSHFYKLFHDRYHCSPSEYRILKSSDYHKW